jgi:hypothetical protein
LVSSASGVCEKSIGSAWGADLGDAQEVVVDEDAIRPPKLFGERQQGDAVADAEGMIGHDHQRASHGHGDRPLGGGDIEPRADHVEKRAHHARAFSRDLGPPAVVDRQQGAPPRQILDGAHGPALPARIARGCIGERIGLHGSPAPPQTAAPSQVF